MLHLLGGRMVTPTIVVGREVLVGFAQNRARLEEFFPRGDAPSARDPT